MNDIHRLKKQLVSGAIHENLDLIRGRVPAVQRVKRRRLRRAIRLGLLVATLAALLAVSGWQAVRLGFVSRAMEHPRAQRVAQWLLPQRATPPEDEPQGPAVTLASAPLELESELRFDRPPIMDREVFPLTIKRVILDPGHGGGNRGTAGSNLVEKEITLDIARRLRGLLEQRGYEVAMTRDDDRDVELKDRVAYANEQRGDVFLSIHVNWLSERSIRGVETFYLGTTDDPELRELAQAENLESGYSLTDFRKLLEGLYTEMRQEESRSFAASVQHSLHRSLRVLSPELRNRGIKTAPFVVLIGTEMPAILAEVSCLSNEREARMLKDAGYRDYIALALFDGIVRYADSLLPADLVSASTVEAAS